jgi:hypothetical protein
MAPRKGLTVARLERELRNRLATSATLELKALKQSMAAYTFPIFLR